jgi:hypothetical protein
MVDGRISPSRPIPRLSRDDEHAPAHA